MLSLLVLVSCLLFFFNDTATTEIYTLSLHDALPICTTARRDGDHYVLDGTKLFITNGPIADIALLYAKTRSEEHTSELQSLTNLVCRLLLEKKKKKTKQNIRMLLFNFHDSSDTLCPI